MRKKILIAVAVLAVIVAVFAGVVAMQPSEYRVVRSATIDGSPEEVFDLVNDFHAWEAWSPWSKLDPAATSEFTGPSSGKGASFKWSGNDDIGEGVMTITDSQPHDLIRLDLEFIRPFPGQCVTEFAFKPEGEQTEVTWSMSGENDFFSKAVCMFMDMDAMLGANFEEGLANMNKVAKAAKSE